MFAAFDVFYQIVVPAPSDVAGPAFLSRSPVKEVVVVADEPSQFGKVIAENLKLEPGQEVEVTQWRRLAGSASHVFVRKAEA